jgi:ribosomal protein S18 acetylase RimI-like enzyme
MLSIQQGVAVGDIVLGEATDADVPTIVALVRSAFEEYRGRLDPPSGALDETAERVRQRMKVARVVFAQARVAALGCVFYERRDDHVYLFRLAVLPRFRRQGIGRALISRVEADARALNFPRVRLGVRVALPDLRAYYERFGYRFVESGSHAGYSEPTYVILEKALDPRDLAAP